MRLAASNGGFSPAGSGGFGAVATVTSMKAWAVQGVELPFGDTAGSWWIDVSGSVHDRPVAGPICCQAGLSCLAWLMLTPILLLAPARRG
jgi:hypothetical protein